MDVLEQALAVFTWDESILTLHHRIGASTKAIQCRIRACKYSQKTWAAYISPLIFVFECSGFCFETGASDEAPWAGIN